VKTRDVTEALLAWRGGHQGIPVDAALPAGLREAESVLTALASVFSPGASRPGGPSPALIEQPAGGEEEWPAVEDIYRILVEQIPAVVFVAFLDKGLSEAYISPQIESTLGFTQAEWLGDPVRWYRQIHPEDKARWSVEAAQTLLTGDPLRSVYRVLARDGRVVWFHCEVKLVRHADGRPWFIHGVGFDITNLKVAGAELQQARDELEARVRERTAALQQANAELHTEIAERRRAETERQALQQQLLETSRRAGMADVAANVLHNVGNVLNSINVTTNLLASTLRQSPLGDLGRVAAMLQEHAADAGSYLTSDPKGQQIPGYLSKLAEYLAEERTTMLSELAALGRNVEHIRQIISMQQSLARFGGLQEPVHLPELMEQALRINLAALERQRTRIVREFAAQPQVLIDRHLGLQILVNLISNAAHAMGASPKRQHCLTLRVGPADREGWVRLQVCDTGVGIPPAHLTRIFAQGFTTKKDGHGFGLHSSAIAAKRMVGTLLADSPGEGQGATFTLEFPAQPVEGQ
jgi:PAS domain S-box-containing protein